MNIGDRVRYRNALEPVGIIVNVSTDGSRLVYWPDGGAVSVPATTLDQITLVKRAYYAEPGIKVVCLSDAVENKLREVLKASDAALALQELAAHAEIDPAD